MHTYEMAMGIIGHARTPLSNLFTSRKRSSRCVGHGSTKARLVQEMDGSNRSDFNLVLCSRRMSSTISLPLRINWHPASDSAYFPKVIVPANVISSPASDIVLISKDKVDEMI